MLPRNWRPLPRKTRWGGRSSMTGSIGKQPSRNRTTSSPFRIHFLLTATRERLWPRAMLFAVKNSTGPSRKRWQSTNNELEAPQRQAAIDHEHLAGGITQVAPRQHSGGFADLLCYPPAGLHQQSFSDHLVILGFHAGRHVGANDAGADFKNRNVKLAQACGPKFRPHRHAGFGVAITASVDRGLCRGYRGNVDHAAPPIGVGLLLLDHPARALLREKVGALQIHLEHPVETLLRRFENVGANFGRDAGIVDKSVQPAKFFPDRIEQPPSCRGGTDIGLNVECLRAELAQLGQRGRGGGWVAQPANGEGD